MWWSKSWLLEHSDHLKEYIMVHFTLHYYWWDSLRSQLSNARSLMFKTCLDRFLTLSTESVPSENVEFWARKKSVNAKSFIFITKHPFATGQSLGSILQIQVLNFQQKQHLLLKRNTCCYSGHEIANIHKNLELPTWNSGGLLHVRSIVVT